MRRAALLLLFGVGACAANPPASQKMVVYFEEWSAALDDAAQATIATAAAWAKDHPGELVTVTGYADPTGSQDANVAMSRTRAQVVLDQLLHDGVPRGRIVTAAKGPTDFTASSQESRRVEVAIQGG